MLPPPDFATAQKAQAALEQNRPHRAGARAQDPADAETNAEAFADIEADCHVHAAALKERGVTPMLVAGAGLVQKRLVALDASAVPVLGGAPVSTTVGAAAALAGSLRDAIYRVLPGPRNAEVRRRFGIHIPFSLRSPTSVRNACKNLSQGKRSAPTSAGAQLMTASDVARLDGFAKSILTETGKAAKVRAAVSSRATDLEIENAALEIFYDRYAAAIGLVLMSDELARLKSLHLVPRRPERRGRGAAPTTTTAPPLKT